MAASARLADCDADTLLLESVLRRHQQVRFTSALLTPDNPVFRDCLAARSALVVCTPSVERLYGRQLRRYVATLPSASGVEFMVLRRTESSKTLAAAVEVCERAADVGLRRTSPIIAIGGGVCGDICGLAATLYHRGVPSIKVPTTLVGLVDAGVGTKTAVNHGGMKSALGSFHPPESSVLDLGFLASLPRRHLLTGMAEIIKLAIVRDAMLFNLLADEGRELVRSRFQSPESAGVRVVRLAVLGMLAELSGNLFEIVDYRRKVDFGHTFSPYLETASRHAVVHGEAVAMDVALSAQIAAELGLLGADDLDHILSLIQDVGLPLTWPPLSVSGLCAALPAVAEHRDGDLHLVVPTTVGDCAYLGIHEISPGLIRTCHERLIRRGRLAPTRAALARTAVGADEGVPG